MSLEKLLTAADTEDTERAQRNTLCNLCVLCVCGGESFFIP